MLIRGDIFLNTSLTEAFCMAVIEAVSCGLLVVSTKVGGIPEVLPPPFIQFVEPDVKSIEQGLVNAVYTIIRNEQPKKQVAHNFVRNTYNWRELDTLGYCFETFYNRTLNWRNPWPILA